MMSEAEAPVEKPQRKPWSEDVSAIVNSAVMFILAAISLGKSDDGKWSASMADSVGKVGSWSVSPIEGLAGTASGLIGVFALGALLFSSRLRAATPASSQGSENHFANVVYFVLVILGLFIVGVKLDMWAIVFLSVASTSLSRPEYRKFALAFTGVFALALLANVMEAQELVKHYGLSSALWALLLGLLIANTVGLPGWLKPAVMTEFYIKTGLVLLGAEVLLPKLVALGVPGIFVAWVVTPIVLITTYWFGQRVLKIESKSLNMVVAADMSVCGVSAAIATAAACKAKKEELSLAVAMSLLFTVVMMVVMPGIIQAVGMDPILGGAWMGGTIDSTGAVAAAGDILGEDALYVATTVKMIQNILIGVTALCVAIYWTAVVEKADGQSSVGVGEIWKRFPKFVLGFVAASVVFSLVYQFVADGPEIVKATTGVTKTLRGWWFALAFVSIGLESNFREFAKTLSGGKPLLLYLCGQAFNLCLTLGMAWLMFRVVFKDWVETALAK